MFKAQGDLYKFHARKYFNNQNHLKLNYSL